MIRIPIERIEQQIPERGDFDAVQERILAHVRSEGLRR
jgi:hypothetical protein